EPDEARAAVERLERDLREAATAAARLPRAQAELAELEASHDALLDELHAAQRATATLEEKRIAAEAAAGDAEAQIAQALPGVTPESLLAILADLEDVAAALTRARVALVQHEQAVRRVDDLTSQATTSAVELGFAD